MFDRDRHTDDIRLFFDSPNGLQRYVEHFKVILQTNMSW